MSGDAMSANPNPATACAYEASATASAIPARVSQGPNYAAPTFITKPDLTVVV